jgi:hypothetical protein
MTFKETLKKNASYRGLINALCQVNPDLEQSTCTQFAELFFKAGQHEEQMAAFASANNRADEED